MGMDARMGIPSEDTEKLYDRYWSMVFIRCRQLLGDAEAAEDAAQEVFLKMLENKSLNAKYPSSLLWTMATNLCLDILRKRGRRHIDPDSESLLERIACAADVEATVNARGILRKLFGAHPASSRTIAVLYLVDGMTLEEVARETGMSVAGVHKRLMALRKYLRELCDL